jgi:hypothetical protein
MKPADALRQLTDMQRSAKQRKPHRKMVRVSDNWFAPEGTQLEDQFL